MVSKAESRHLVGFERCMHDGHAERPCICEWIPMSDHCTSTLIPFSHMLTDIEAFLTGLPLTSSFKNCFQRQSIISGSWIHCWQLFVVSSCMVLISY